MTLWTPRCLRWTCPSASAEAQDGHPLKRVAYVVAHVQLPQQVEGKGQPGCSTGPLRRTDARCGSGELGCADEGLTNLRRILRPTSPVDAPEAGCYAVPFRRFDDGTEPRADGGARRPRDRGRLLRQPRHRDADAVRQLHPGRRRRDAAERERPAGHRAVPDRRRDRRRPHQRRQGDGDRGARCQLLQQRPELRDDPRRAHRPRDPGGHAGLADRRPRQLDDSRRDGQGPRRGHGPRERREAGAHRHGPRVEAGRPEDPRTSAACP